MIFEVTFYRRVMSGWEFSSNRLFRNKISAIKLLRALGYRLIEGETFVYSKPESRATITERIIE